MTIREIADVTAFVCDALGIVPHVEGLAAR
jgi:hypothetical protein